MKHLRTMGRIAAVLTAMAAAVALAAPVMARPLDRGTYHFEDTFVDDDFCGAGLAIQIEILFRRLRRCRRRWRLVRRNPHVPVPLEARAGGNQPPHRHVLLQPAQVIDLPGD